MFCLFLKKLPILVLILYTITTKPTEDAVYDKYKYLTRNYQI